MKKSYYQPKLFILNKYEAFRAVMAMEFFGITLEYMESCYPKYVKNGKVDISQVLLDITDKCKEN